MSLQKSDIKSRLLITMLVLTGTAAIIILAVGGMPPPITALSPDDQNTVENIHELTSWIKADCKKMTINDFHLERDPPNLRSISRRLAEECISGE